MHRFGTSEKKENLSHSIEMAVKGKLQRKIFISINESWLYQITIYVIKFYKKIK